MSDRAESKQSSLMDRILNRPAHFWMRLLCVLLLLVSLQTLLIIVVSLSVTYATDDRIYDTENLSVLAEEGLFDDVDCIVVLGAGLRDDGTPSFVLQNRVQTAVAVYETGEGHLLLMSGDQTGAYDEPRSMTDHAQNELGVPAEDILQDKKGYSTYESLWRLKQAGGAKKIVIVTQRYHLPRSLYIADRLGFEAIGVAADSEGYRPPLKNEVREILARFKDMFRVERTDAVSTEGLPVIARPDV